MPIGSTQAFVLSTTPLNEQDKLVSLLTAEKGILKAVAPGSLKAGNRFGALLELFTEGDFFYYWKENKEIITISKGEIINSHFNLVSDSTNIFYFYMISEVLLKFVPANQRDKRIYRLIASIIKSRENGTDMAQLLLYFLVWILRIEGMMFDPQVCYNCFCKDIRMAWLKTDFRGILCQKCRTSEKFMLKNEELQYIKWTESNSPSHLNSWNKKIDEAKLIRIFIKKIEHHGECAFKSSLYLSQFK